MPLEMITKQYVAKIEVEDTEKAVIAFISTATVDRDKEVILPKGGDFTAFEKNPVVLWSHQYAETPIGRAMWIKRKGNGIIAKTQFADTPKAQEIYSLFKAGILAGFSIGFIPHKFHAPEPDEIKSTPEWAEAKRIYDKWELVEYSAVAVPANPEALAIDIKTKGLQISTETLKELGIIENKIIEPDIKVQIKVQIDDGKNITVGEVLKPFPNEHSCRLESPDKYDRFARKNCEQKHDGKCIDIIYGIKDNKSEIQSLRFNKDVWTASAAHSVCSGRDGTFEAAEPEKIVAEVHEIKAKPHIEATPFIEVITTDRKVIVNEVIETIKGRMF